MKQKPLMLRLVEALERLSPPPAPELDMHSTDAFIWHPAKTGRAALLEPVSKIAHVPFDILYGIDDARDELYANTKAFTAGLAANHALLWGARGTGKSSLIKAIHARINTENPVSLAIVEIARGDLGTLPDLLATLRAYDRRFLLFCDDLSFDYDDTGYKSLKAVLDGGIAGCPDNVLLYATSNRRHLMPEDMIDNERSTAIHPSEAVEEKVSLADRFGISIGFYPIDQDTYIEIIKRYISTFALKVDKQKTIDEALQWSIQRGARSGRTAWQFIQHVRALAHTK